MPAPQLHRIPWDDYVRLVFTFCSFPLYLLYMVVLLRNRNKELFNSAFFRLSLAVGAFDIACILHNNCLILIPYYGIISADFFDRFATSTPFCIYVYCGAGFYACFQWLMATAMAINRYTALFTPLKHKKVVVL